MKLYENNKEIIEGNVYIYKNFHYSASLTPVEYSLYAAKEDDCISKDLIGISQVCLIKVLSKKENCKHFFKV